MSQTRNQPSRWAAPGGAEEEGGGGGRRREIDGEEGDDRDVRGGRRGEENRGVVVVHGVVVACPWRRRRACRCPWRKGELSACRGVVRGSPGDGVEASRLASRGRGPDRVRACAKADGRYSGTAATSVTFVRGVRRRGGRRGDEDGDGGGRGAAATRRFGDGGGEGGARARARGETLLENTWNSMALADSKSIARKTNRTYYVRTLIFSVAILDRRRRRPLTDSLPPAPRGRRCCRAGPPAALPHHPFPPSFVPILPLVKPSPIAASKLGRARPLPAVQLPASRGAAAAQDANPGNGNAHNHLAPRLMNAGMRWPGGSRHQRGHRAQFRERG